MSHQIYWLIYFFKGFLLDFDALDQEKTAFCLNLAFSKLHKNQTNFDLDENL